MSISEPATFDQNSPVFDFSLVVPCYMDAPHLIQNSLKIADYLHISKMRWEIIFVEDGSADNTREIVVEAVAALTQQGHSAKAIFHPVNMGRGKAVTDGILAARGAIVGFIDIDLEHMVDSLLSMIDKIARGHTDVVVGRRVIYNGIAKPIRVLCSHAYRALAHLVLDLPVSDTECGLKVFNRKKILPILELTKNRHWFWDTEVIHRAFTQGLRIEEHLILFVENPKKPSTVRLVPDVIAYLKAIFLYRASLGRDSCAIHSALKPIKKS